MSDQLVPLPTQPADTPWPTTDWPEGDPPPEVDREALDALLDAAFAEPQPATTEHTRDVVVVWRGRLVAERYAPDTGPDDVQPAWSMTKSILHAVVGILVRDGRLSVASPVPVPEWQQPGDPRAAITLDSLLHMTSGLRFCEDYVDDRVSDVIKMLFRPGADDTGAFAAAFPADHPPGQVSNYSSGTSNIISAIVKRVVGGGDEYLAFLRRELFNRVGMASAKPRFDRSGTWIASSFCHCTPRDFARFGLLILRDGVWDGERILPEGWVDYARTPAPVQPDDDEFGYGAHWWLTDDGLGTFSANRYVGQYLFLVPALDLIVVRNGNTAIGRRPHVVRMISEIIGLFRSAGERVGDDG